MGISVSFRRTCCFISAFAAVVLLSSLIAAHPAWATDYSQVVKAKISSVTTKSMVVKWSVPSGMTQGKTTLYQVKGNKKKKLKVFGSNVNSCKVKHLKKGKTYKFLVVAKSAAGKKFTSQVVTSKTASARKSKNAAKVSFASAKLSLKELQHMRISAKARTKSGKSPFDRKVTYYSSNEKIARVTAAGEVTAVAAGKCRIYCVAHNGVASFAELTVSQGVLVLGYHGVATPEEKRTLYPNERFTISTTTFEQQIKRLHDKGYRSLTCEEFYRWQTGKAKLPKRSVLITFDDGRYSAVKNAPAILDKYGMKSTWFVIGKRSMESLAFDPNRYTATVDDLRGMKDAHPSCELQGHSYGLHDVDQAGNHLIFSKTQAQVEEDCVLLNLFAQQFGTDHFPFYAYPYGSDPVWYQKGVAASGVKMAFDYGSDQLASQLDSRWSVKRVGVRTTTTNKIFDSFVR